MAQNPSLPPGEPPRSRASFEADPFDAARDSLIREVLSHAAGAEDAIVPRRVREAAAADTLAHVTRDDAVVNKANDAALYHARLAAAAPSQTVGHIAGKLALLVRSMLGDDAPAQDAVQLTHLALAAGALADLTIIGDHAIALPPEAAEPIAGATDAARWRRRAGGAP